MIALCIGWHAPDGNLQQGLHSRPSQSHAKVTGRCPLHTSFKSADVNQTRKEEQLLSHAIVFVQLESSCALISQILEKVHIVSACAIPPTCIPRIALLCTPVYPSGKLGGGVPAQVYAFG